VQIKVLAVTSFLEAFFIVLIFAPIIMLWAAAIVDIIRREYSGWATAGWLLFVIVLPIFGTLIYFIVRKPTKQEIADARSTYAQSAPVETERRPRPPQ
jgi:Phospholipase_D-nuclease N-terminal